MRPAPILPGLAAALCLASLPALAQQPGWIDPPAKPPTAEPAEGQAATGAANRSAEPPPSAVRASEPVAPGMANATPARVASGTKPEASARRLVTDYLATVSHSDMAEAAPRFYGGWVRFHDRLLSRQALVAEKRRFVRRWPERRYAAEGTPRVACSAASETCVVRAIVRFDAASAERGRRSRGLAELVLTITLTEGRPVIVAETSRVVRRGLASRAGERFIPAG